MDLPEPQFSQHPADRKVPRPMERRIDDPDIPCHLPDHFRMDALLFQFFHIAAVDLLTDDVVKTELHRLFLCYRGYPGKAFYRCHMRQDIFVMGRRDLAPVLPVDFISVISCRIMAGRDHDPGCASQLPHRKG